MDRRKVASGVGFPREGNYGRSRLNRLTAGVRAGIEERLGEREKIDTLSKSLQGLILRFEAAADAYFPQNVNARLSRRLSIARMKRWFKEEITLRTFVSLFCDSSQLVGFVIRADLGNMGHFLAALQKEADLLR